MEKIIKKKSKLNISSTIKKKSKLNISSTIKKKSKLNISSKIKIKKSKLNKSSISNKYPLAEKTVGNLLKLIKYPLITEKSQNYLNSTNIKELHIRYALVVDRLITKPELKKVAEVMFSGKVKKIHTIMYPIKTKKTQTKKATAKKIGTCPRYKKAYIELKNNV